MLTKMVMCYDCGEETECQVIREEFSEYTDIPEECPHCNESFYDSVEKDMPGA